jgi:hypothetical protein
MLPSLRAGPFPSVLTDVSGGQDVPYYETAQRMGRNRPRPDGRPHKADPERGANEIVIMSAAPFCCRAGCP